ncbi:hypothetical protein D046_1264B, partial [Vibrio parahaemolyticus V-223/04]
PLLISCKASPIKMVMNVKFKS